MDEKETTLSMDETDKPDLVDAPTIDHGMKAKPEPQETEVEAKLERERGPDGKFVSKDQGDKPAEEAASAPPAPEESNVPVKALQEERRKRQELEQQVAAMQAQFAKPKPPEAPPAFWDDPDRALEARMEQFGTQIIQRFQQQQTMERINASETVAKGKYADYDDAFRAFQQAASANPSLIQRMTAASDPAEFAYKTGKTAIDLEKVGSMDELLAQKRAEWEAEVRAAAPQPKQTFPASTVSDGSVASRGGPVWSGPTQDRDILPMG
jgi:hypothetical protein